jgi:low molecular weight protein-tyrosine phosphatase
MLDLPEPRPRRLLFVCSGNICRSPLAEAVFRDLARKRGVHDHFQVDSAGTHGWHEGEPADARARSVGAAHGLSVDSIARPVKTSDFESFGLILAMDHGHLRELRSRCPAAHRGKIRLLREFDGEDTPGDVPDPYYDGVEAFESVYRLLDASCRRLLDALL